MFASQSAADYFLRVYDLAPERIELIEHGAIIDLDRPRPPLDPDLIFDEPLRLGFVGLGWPKKGLDVVNRLADRLAGTGIEIHHFGELRADAVATHVHVHGPYDNEVLPELLDRAGIQVVLLPGAVRRDLRPRDDRGARRRPAGDRRVLRRARRAHPGRRARLDDRPRGPGRRSRPWCARSTATGPRSSGPPSAVHDLVLRPVAATADRYANMYRRPGPAGRSREEGP